MTTSNTKDLHEETRATAAMIKGAVQCGGDKRVAFKLGVSALKELFPLMAPSGLAYGLGAVLSAQRDGQ